MIQILYKNEGNRKISERMMQKSANNYIACKDPNPHLPVLHAYIFSRLSWPWNNFFFIKKIYPQKCIKSQFDTVYIPSFSFVILFLFRPRRLAFFTWVDHNGHFLALAAISYSWANENNGQLSRFYTSSDLSGGELGFVITSWYMSERTKMVWPF